MINENKACKKCNHFPTVVLGHDSKELSDSEIINEYRENRINDDFYILLKNGERFVLDNLNHETLRLQINKKKNEQLK